MKSNYLNKLEREFYFVSDEERAQIIAEYEVHFEERIKEGSTIEQVIKDLGTPKSVAIEYATELDINYSTLDKNFSNFKRDSNIYWRSLKRKMRDIKNEEALKRKNKKSYSENNSDSIDIESNKTSEPPHIIKISFKYVTYIFYLIRIILTLIINFFAFIIGVTFLLITISCIIIAVALPFFISFMNYTYIMWILVYGMIIPLTISFAIIALVCLKFFGRKQYE